MEQELSRIKEENEFLKKLISEIPVSCYLNIDEILTKRQYTEDQIIELLRKELNERQAIENQLQLLLNSTAEAIYQIDTQGNCVFCNKACVEQLGYQSPSNLLGKNMHNLIHSKHADGTHLDVTECRIFQAFQKGVNSHVDDEVLWRADGSCFPAEYWSYPIRQDGVVCGSVVTFLDITDCKKTEQLSIENEQRFREIFNSTGEAIFIHEITTGKIIDCNDRTIEMYGFASKNEVLACTIGDLSVEVESYTKENAHDLIQKTLTEGSQIFEWQAKNKNGVLFWVEVCLNQTEIAGNKYVLAVVRNVSERKKNEIELFRKQHEVQAILDASVDVVVLINSDGQFLACNEKLAKRWNLPKEELIDQSAAKILPPHIFEGRLERARKVIATGIHEQFVDNYNGSYYEVSIEPVYEIDGTIKNVAMFSRDVTDTIKTNEKIRESEIQYRYLFEQNPAPMLIYQRGTFRFLAVNEAFEKKYGYTKDDIKSMVLTDLYPIEEKNAIKDLANSLKGLAYVGEWHHVKKDGTEMTIIATSHDLVYNEFDSRIAVITDITERKAMENVIQKSENRLRKAQEIAHVGNWELDLKTNQIWLSNEAKKIYGLTNTNKEISLEDVLQIALKRRKAPLDKAVNFLKILKKEYKEEYQIKRANDGELRTIFSIAELELSPNEEPIKVIGVIQDITERKKSEQELLKAKERAEESEQRLQMKNEEYETINEELRQTNEELLFAKERAEESEMLLRHIADNVADSVVFRLVAENDGYRKFVFISNNVRQMYGFEPQEVIDDAQLLYSRIFKDDVEKLAAEEIIAISNQKVLRAQIRFVNNNNEVRWAYVVSCPHQYKGMVYWDGILIDITSQKNNEQELKKAIDLAELKEIELHKKNKEYEAINEELTQTNRELFIAKEKAEKNEEILKEAQALAHIGNWELNLENNKLFWSDEIYKIFDCNQQEFTATCESVVDFIHPDDREMVNQAFLDHIAMKKTYEITHRILLKSGNIKYINDRCKTYYNENGKPTKSVGTISDITNQITITNQLREAKEKAEEGDKLKTAFLQNMSHEIRTPMNAIVGFSALLCDEGLTDEKRKSFTTIIQNSSNQLLSIVSDILTISSVETKQAKVTKQKVHVNDMLFELLSIFKIQAENKNISIYSKQQLTDNQSLIYTDKTKLNQILTNLLTNALKFTHEGFIEFGYTIVSGELEFYVKDTGIGIKSDVQEKIFERFRQANTSIEKRYGGTGLGLAISKAFVELLGGKIHVESELGKGSVFYFTIPFMPVENQIIEVGELQKTKKHRFLVLVAEDEEYNFLLINELLKSFPVDVIHAKDGQEAVEFCKSNKNINLILMDIRMPKMNGYEATMIIKELNSNIPIIAQTAYSSENETDMFKQKGFEDCITKPINQSKFNMLIEKYMKNFQVN